MPRRPDVSVNLTGKDGNPFAIIGAVQRAMREAEVPEEEISEFVAEATRGDYDNLLRAAMRWVDVN